MANSEEDRIRDDLARVLGSGDEAEGIEIARRALETGYTPTTFFLNVIQPLLHDVGKRFERLEIFLPELMKAAKVVQAMQTTVLEPAIRAQEGQESKTGTVVVGACKGDIHDIGKNMVALMLQVNGFKVIDLGTDVSMRDFVEAARKADADIIGMSSLLTTSMPYMGDLIAYLDGVGLRNKFKIIVGGAPVTPDYAEKIGADAYGADAVDAVAQCLRLIDLPA
jgi:methylmalonyl-CoA mutase cobalamin-binding domain/chain